MPRQIAQLVYITHTVAQSPPRLFLPPRRIDICSVHVPPQINSWLWNSATTSQLIPSSSPITSSSVAYSKNSLLALQKPIWPNQRGGRLLAGTRRRIFVAFRSGSCTTFYPCSLSLMYVSLHMVHHSSLCQSRHFTLLPPSVTFIGSFGSTSTRIMAMSIIALCPFSESMVSPIWSNGSGIHQKQKAGNSAPRKKLLSLVLPWLRYHPNPFILRPQKTVHRLPYEPVPMRFLSLKHRQKRHISPNPIHLR